MIKENIKNNSIKPVSGLEQWYVIDAKDKILGRLSTFLAIRLMGKHKVSYSDNECIKDKIVVINAKKIILTGRKINKKKYWHTGYPGGIKSKPYNPGYVIRRIILIIHFIKYMIEPKKFSITFYYRNILIM